MERPLSAGNSHILRLTIGWALLWAVLNWPMSFAAEGDSFEQRRQRMVRNYIAAEGVRNPRVLSAMKSVPRHEFVLPAKRKYAYEDLALAIGHKQTISPPFIVAYMTESIDPQPTDRVLEIGTGSGYQAAVLSKIVKDVFSIEIVEPLGLAAAKRLKRLGYENVHTRVGDGFQGWSEHAPFDKIIVTCSPEDIPDPLVKQLKEGGKMIIPLGQRFQQVFHLLEKRDGKLVTSKLIPTLFVPMTGISETRRKVQPDATDPRLVNGSFERDENDDSRPDGWHYLRQANLSEKSAPVGKRCLVFDNRDPGRGSQALQGLGVDGRRVGRLRFLLWVSNIATRRGNAAHERASLTVHFYDSERRPIGDAVVGPWTGTSGWRRVGKTVDVPRQTRAVVVRVGLNGGLGTLAVDGLELSSQRR